MKTTTLSISLILLSLTACSRKSTGLNQQALEAERAQQELAKKIATAPEQEVGKSFIEPESRREMGPEFRAGLIQKARDKREESSLFRTNESIVAAMGEHSKIYPFTGKYRVMVIPVQFSDVKFSNPNFFKKGADGKSEAQDYIFGQNKNSMTKYYQHASLGKFDLDGEVTPIVTVDNPLVSYGKAISGRSDNNARGLVVDALKKLKLNQKNRDWWLSFDNWDLSDYDRDKNFHEPDGFVDAVILIYAGKSQASCQRSFDPEGKRPASDDVPAGPRQDSAVECFNRIWPHRWSIALSTDDADYTTEGPMVEGRQRPAMNGLKINDQLFALDYNMQSEFSDRSTFIHEFGHSLSLPDVYSAGKSNSTGSWEVMSQNGALQAQEMSSYSKISLGWLSPKVIKQGESTSAYLGAYNYVANKQREDNSTYRGPELNRDDESIVSTVPDSGESVYRSIMVVTDPSEEEREVVEFPDYIGGNAAYTGRFDGESRSLTYTFKVPKEGNATVSFDTIYHIETETNFNSKDEVIKVVTDFDIGQVNVNGKTLDKFRLFSGDENENSLVEKNPFCMEEETLALRLKVNRGEASDEEKEQYKIMVGACQQPIWLKKSYDLSEYRGQEVKFQITYTTDAGYTEFGIVVDNIKLPGQDRSIDFENGEGLQEFKLLVQGIEKLHYNQFYLFEHRLPGEKYQNLLGKSESYNMDNNIKVGSQSFFVNTESTPLENFRMVTFDYQPGVLVWYFNSKYVRSSAGNTARRNGGKGYLLVLNSKVKEVPIPGFSDTRLYNEFGHYPEIKLEDGLDNPLEELVKSQRDEFICFSHTRYATYLTGTEPSCNGEFKDYMLNLSFNGLKLQYRRERFNEFLPTTRYSTYGVGVPFRTAAGIRTGLSTFRPSNTGEFRPFKIYKAVENQMVLDTELTENTVSFAPISSFRDSENALEVDEAYRGDTVVVEKQGFRFEVVSPSRQIVKRYSTLVSGESNQSYIRRPRTKIYFDWE